MKIFQSENVITTISDIITSTAYNINSSGIFKRDWQKKKKKKEKQTPKVNNS